MNRRWLVLAAVASGCFSDPPPSGSGESSDTSAGSSSDTAPGSESSTSSSTATTEPNPGTTIGATTNASSSTNDTTMGSGDDTAGDSTGDPPLVAFCENQAGPNLIACSDFDGGNASPWDPYEPQGFIRSVGASKPPAHSAPNFARVVRDDTNVDNAVGQALFGVDFSPSALEFGGASVEMQVRFPAQFEESCGSAPVRLFEIRYGEKGAFTNLVVAASPDEVVVYYFSPGANDELGRFSVPETPPQGGWYRFELELTFGEGAADASLSLGGELVVPSQLTPPAFNPASQDVSVNVGPWFLPGEAPGEGCGYDLDDLRLSGLPSL